MITLGDTITAYGDAGDDTIAGGGYNDTIQGGDGADSLTGGAGTDNMTGDAGDDNMQGGAGADTVNGGTGNDYIAGDAGADTIYGGTGNDTILGGADADSIFGDAGNDSILGGTGNDTIQGGAGDDTINAGEGNDSVTGGTGNDTFAFSTGLVGGETITITDFDHVSQADKIDLSSILSNLGANAPADKSSITMLTSALNLGGALNTVTTAISMWDDGTDTYVYVTIDNNDVWQSNADLVIKLVGVTGSTERPVLGDFVLTPPPGV
jgi:Ca2+-binding RTX toxin-like protein